LQTSATLPLHRVVSAVHVVMVEHDMVAASHPCEHTCCVDHMPLALQTWRTVPAHWSAPGMHVPPLLLELLLVLELVLVLLLVLVPLVLVLVLVPVPVLVLVPLVLVLELVLELLEHEPMLQVPVVQGSAGLQSVQPLACMAQVWVSGPRHCVAPTAHWSLHIATHLAPEQVSDPGQAVGGFQS
jgi:hypothetical protein